MKADDTVFYTYNAATNLVDGFGRQAGRPCRWPVLRRRDGSAQSDLRRRHAAQVHVQRQHLQRESQHDAGRRRDVALQLGGRRQELPVRPRQCARHGRSHDLHVQPDQGRRVHGRLCVGRPAGGRRSAVANSADAVLHRDGRAGRDDRRLQRPGVIEQHRARRDRPAVHVRSGSRQRDHPRRREQRPSFRSRPA